MSVMFEQVETAVDFWKYTDTINGREWLYSCPMWLHSGKVDDKDYGNSLGVLVAYVRERLFKGKVPCEVIENSFYQIYNDGVKRKEFIAFLEIITIKCMNQN